jgi:hypothetical protein
MTAGLLFDEFSVKKFSDLFTLDREKLLMLEGFKDAKADNLLTSIENSKNIDFDKFIYALGIDNVGKKTAKDLAKKFGDINQLMSAEKDDLIGISDIGDVVADCIVNYFLDAENIDEINKYPVSAVIFFAVFVASFIIFLFSASFIEKIVNLSNMFSIFETPLFASFVHIDANAISLIALFRDDVSSFMSLITLFALLKVFSLIFSNVDNVNKEFSPINKILNFSITLFLISLFALLPTFCNDSIICGAAFISLIMLLKSLSFIFNFSFVSLNILDIIFIFNLPKMISFNEISLSFLNESTRVENPPPLFCFSIFFIIASATF